MGDSSLMHNCQNCLQEVRDDILYCPNCGAPQNQTTIQGAQPLRPQEHEIPASGLGRRSVYPSPKKNPWLSAILNFFLPGLGYVYNGIGRETSQVIFGVIVFLSVFLGVYVPLFGAPASPTSGSAAPQITVYDLLTLLILILPLGLAFDGYARAKRINSSSGV